MQIATCHNRNLNPTRKIVQHKKKKIQIISEMHSWQLQRHANDPENGFAEEKTTEPAPAQAIQTWPLIE